MQWDGERVNHTKSEIKPHKSTAHRPNNINTIARSLPTYCVTQSDEAFFVRRCRKNLPSIQRRRRSCSSSTRYECSSQDSVFVVWSLIWRDSLTCLYYHNSCQFCSCWIIEWIYNRRRQASSSREGMHGENKHVGEQQEINGLCTWCWMYHRSLPHWIWKSM